jgi:hypothetical protein
LEPATTSPRSEPHTNTSPPAITSEFWFTSPRTCVFADARRQTSAGEAKKNRQETLRLFESRRKMRNGPERRTSVARRARAPGGRGERETRDVTYDDRSGVPHGLPSAQRALHVQRRGLQRPRLGRARVAELFREAGGPTHHADGPAVREPGPSAGARGTTRGHALEPARGARRRRRGRGRHRGRRARGAECLIPRRDAPIFF